MLQNASIVPVRVDPNSRGDCSEVWKKITVEAIVHKITRHGQLSAHYGRKSNHHVIWVDLEQLFGYSRVSSLVTLLVGGDYAAYLGQL